MIPATKALSTAARYNANSTRHSRLTIDDTRTATEQKIYISCWTFGFQTIKRFNTRIVKFEARNSKFAVDTMDFILSAWAPLDTASIELLAFTILKATIPMTERKA